jgi:hypothetical protein
MTQQEVARLLPQVKRVVDLGAPQDTGILPCVAKPSQHYPKVAGHQSSSCCSSSRKIDTMNYYPKAPCFKKEPSQ